MRLFMLAPLAIVVALSFGAAAELQLNGGVNQEGADYDLTCTASASISWSDTWMNPNPNHPDIPGQFYKEDATVSTTPVGNANHPSACMGMKVKVVRTDGHGNQIGDIGEGTIDHTGSVHVVFTTPVPVKDVKDAHVLIYNP